jgi:hypothetical protein
MSRNFRLHRAPVDVLNYEIAEEKAVALGRLGRALEEALTLYARPNELFLLRLDLVDDDAPPHVPVDRAPVRHHVNPVTGRVRFDCADC